ncbi:unnamed protein product [Soboliphyme baturini]|uniref:XRN_N domain-containing protein n=1 Tax=Soboliphyme baturini TaxID=241478 RepID=A0A183ITY1_9BILA|nr:unnamed protein product [Soboliphyme baturini]
MEQRDEALQNIEHFNNLDIIILGDHDIVPELYQLCFCQCQAQMTQEKGGEDGEVSSETQLPDPHRISAREHYTALFVARGVDITTHIQIGVGALVEPYLAHRIIKCKPGSGSVAIIHLKLQLDKYLIFLQIHPLKSQAECDLFCSVRNADFGIRHSSGRFVCEGLSRQQTLESANV